MPSHDSAALVVARFLKANHYSESYDTFVTEAGLPDSAGTAAKGDLTLETLLEEKKTFDISLKFEKLGTSGEHEEWSQPSPLSAQVIGSLPSSSNLLSVAAATLNVDGSTKPFLIATTADRRLHILDLLSTTLHASFFTLSDSPILTVSAFSSDVLLCTTMSGHLLAIDTKGRMLAQRRNHSKYVVACAIFHSSDNDQTSHLIATAGWDNKIHIYHSASSPFTIDDTPSTISLPTKPEALLFITHPDTKEPILLLSRTDSSSLHFYSCPLSPSQQPVLLGTQNLAPHSNAWVAFTPSSLALHPTDPSIVAAGTNSIPHMKVLMVRLLVPPTSPTAQVRDETQTSQARAALAVADKEAAAILIHANTMAPQTAYSTPCVVWRPDASGVWVNGDDGAVRGVEASTGKIVATLTSGHEAGSKIRCLWAGKGGESEQSDELLVSGGFDQRLIAWGKEKA